MFNDYSREPASTLKLIIIINHHLNETSTPFEKNNLHLCLICAYIYATHYSIYKQDTSSKEMDA